MRFLLLLAVVIQLICVTIIIKAAVRTLLLSAVGGTLTWLRACSVGAWLSLRRLLALASGLASLNTSNVGVVGATSPYLFKNAGIWCASCGSVCCAFCGSCVAAVGGSWDFVLFAGLFYWNLSYSASTANTNIGSRQLILFTYIYGTSSSLPLGKNLLNWTGLVGCLMTSRNAFKQYKKHLEADKPFT